MAMSSMALATPTTRGNSHATASFAVRPMRLKLVANRASSDPSRMSQHSASPSPPPAATPLIAPTNGLLSSSNDRNRFLPIETGGICPPLAERSTPLRSAPAQNESPVPVSTTTRTSSSSSAAAHSLETWLT